MMHATVVKEFDFPASHANLHHKGHCSRVHGHTWTLRVYAKGKVIEDPTSSSYGMVVDFAELKNVYKEVIEPFVEHQHLNDSLGAILEEFTTEVIAGWMLEQLSKRLPQVYKVRLYEGKTSYAEVCLTDIFNGTSGRKQLSNVR